MSKTVNPEILIDLNEKLNQAIASKDASAIKSACMAIDMFNMIDLFQNSHVVRPDENSVSQFEPYYMVMVSDVQEFLDNSKLEAFFTIDGDLK